MKRMLIIVIAAAAAIGLTIGGVVLYQMSSPEYMLARTVSDMKESGVEGLQAHLTDRAREKLEAVEGWTENGIVSGILSLLTPEDELSLLKAKLSEMEWTVVDVLKGDSRTDVVLGFQYEDSISGTVDITMIRESGEWKIDGIGIPQFETLSLP